jgi:hypothetical protein
MEEIEDQTCDALVEDQVISTGTRIHTWCGAPATCHVTVQKRLGPADRYYCEKHRPNVPGSTLNYLSGREV